MLFVISDLHVYESHVAFHWFFSFSWHDIYVTSHHNKESVLITISHINFSHKSTFPKKIDSNCSGLGHLLPPASTKWSQGIENTLLLFFFSGWERACSHAHSDWRFVCVHFLFIYYYQIIEYWVLSKRVDQVLLKFLHGFLLQLCRHICSLCSLCSKMFYTRIDLQIDLVSMLS